MSSYFDAKATQFRDLRRSGASVHDEPVRGFIRQLVLDITVACEYAPMAFPPDLRDLAYLRILKSCPEEWPHDVPGYGVDYEGNDEGLRLFADLIEDLHSIFHAAAHAGWPGADNPLAVYGHMQVLAEERYVALIKLHPELNLEPR